MGAHQKFRTEALPGCTADWRSCVWLDLRERWGGNLADSSHIILPAIESESSKKPGLPAQPHPPAQHSAILRAQIRVALDALGLLPRRVAVNRPRTAILRSFADGICRSLAGQWATTDELQQVDTLEAVRSPSPRRRLRPRSSGGRCPPAGGAGYSPGRGGYFSRSTRDASSRSTQLLLSRLRWATRRTASDSFSITTSSSFKSDEA